MVYWGRVDKRAGLFLGPYSALLFGNENKWVTGRFGIFLNLTQIQVLPCLDLPHFDYII